MARSSKKIRRLVSLFHDLETTERAKVGELARDISTLSAAQSDLLTSLASPTAQTEPFLAMMSRSIGSMERRLQHLARQHEAAVQRYVEAAARTHGAEALLDEVRTEEGRKLEQVELTALLEFQQSSALQGRGKSGRSS